MSKIFRAILMFALMGIVATNMAGCDLFKGQEEEQPSTFAITVAGGIGGTVTGGGLYEEDGTVTITATPEEDYVFLNWIQSSEVFSTESTFTFTATGNTSIVAYFVLADQTHLMGEYYVYSFIDSVGRVLNTTEKIMKYSFKDDNTYETQVFLQNIGVWQEDEVGTYYNDNGISVALCETGEAAIKYSYELNLQTGELALSSTVNVWTTITLRPVPETAVRLSATYELIGGTENEEDIIINEEEDERFTFCSDGTFTWSYYVNSVSTQISGTYEMLGLSLILTQGDIGEEIYFIYEFYFYDNGGITDARLVFENKLANNLVSESRIYALLIG